MRTSIGKKCKNQEAFLPIIEELTEALGGLNIIDIFPSSKFLYMVSRVRSRLERMHREADEIHESIISERRANSALASKMGKNEEDDLLGVLLNLQDHGNLEFQLTTSTIKAIILEMFSGGGDTSSTALEWAMSELIKNPRVMEKAQKEVRQVFNDLGTIPDETSLHDLKFLKLIIKETLRLHPSIPLIPRECRKRCNVNGYDIYIKTNTEFPLAQMLYHFDWKPAGGLKPENLDMTESFGGTVKRKRDLKLIPISYRSLVG
ncbi:hypothetical protein Peur_023517 [Populus x canadensis]